MYKPDNDKTFGNWPGSPSSELNRESWKVFQVMGEFVEGFDKMAHVHPAVSIFGSSRTAPDHPYYLLTEQIARESSIGLNIILPGKQEVPNDFQDVSVNFHHFFVRKMMFVKYSAAYIVLPGGFGTLDEVIECLTLIQTSKTPAIPVILVQSSFWKGMLDFFRTTLVEEGTISESDLDLIQLLDTPHEISQAIFDFYAERGFHRPEGKPDFGLTF
jgi:uncharacterized protein (TIGR00730 family)